MEKQIITFSANEQTLTKTGGVDCYASNIVSYIEAQFALGENWSGYDSVRAVWFTDFVGGISTVLDSLGTCIVPYEVLTRKGEVKVNLVGSIADEDVLTDRLTTCPVTAVVVKCNAKVAGANSTPITPSEYEQFVASVRTDADRAEEASVSARTSADEAEASAQNASESASASAVSASDSARSATASAGYAQNASESAQSAENAKDDAEDARDEILGMRATAETLEAGSDATASYSDGLLTLGIPRGDQGIQGVQGETGATPNLTIGTVETLEPTEDATATITGTAEEPVLNLGLPKGDTGEVSLEDLEALLPTDTASGDIVSITDGQSVVPVKSLKVTLEPIQDLHGYDKPWTAGAGKNKANLDFSSPITYNGVTVTRNDDGSITVDGTATTAVTIPFMSERSFPSGTYTISGVPQNSAGTALRVWLRNRVGGTEYISTYDGNSGKVTLTTDTAYIYLTVSAGTTVSNEKCYIQVESGSTATAWTPYSNICPISGHTEVVTHRTGINVWDEEWELGSIKDTDGEYISYTTRICSKNYIPIIGGASYYIHNGSNQEMGIFAYDSEYNYIGAWKSSSWQKSNGTSNATNSAITMPNNASYMKFRVVPNYGTTYNHDISINYPSTDHDYHAYDGETYTTALGQTVYGGTLDVVSGVLTVTHGMYVMNGTESYTQTSTGLFRFAPTPTMASGRWYTDDGAKSDSYRKAELTSDVADGEIVFGSGNNFIYIRDSRAMTIAEFKELLADNNVTITYPLNAPQTIQLTPQEVKLLLGTNNIWSDGNVTLVYSADIQKWVEKKLSGNSTTLTMSRPMTAEPNETETETTETEETE